MTTPERLRRRQRIEFALILLMGIGFFIQNRYFANLAEDQRTCLSSNFSNLASVLNVRANFAEAEARATRAESRANRRFYRDAFASTNRADVFQAYGDYRVRIEKVDDRRDRIAKDRDENPIPAFPRGSCDA